MNNATKQKKPKAPKTQDVIKSVSDDYGNLLVCSNNGKRIILKLKLVNENRYRRVGTINLKQKTIEVRRKRAKHLFRKNESYGLNFKLISETKLFDKVRIIDDYSEWLVPNEYILEHGVFLHFLQNGFEKQKFIELKKIEQFKREAKI